MSAHHQIALDIEFIFYKFFIHNMGDANFPFAAIAVNGGGRSHIHRDRNNIGSSLSIAVGPCVGGNLWNGSKNGDDFSRHGSWVSFGGNCHHGNLPFIGDSEISGAINLRTAPAAISRRQNWFKIK